MLPSLLHRVRDWVVPPDDATAPAEPLPTMDAPRRRDRETTPAERQLAESIAQKLLHGWLQNRHQTLVPLHVNLTRVSPEDRGRFARFAAVAAMAGSDSDASSRLSAWLATAGADPQTLAAYHAALGAPLVLDRVLADVAAPEHASTAYVLALIAAGTGDAGEAGRAFADYVAKRLGLPSAALRSAQRRYGR